MTTITLGDIRAKRPCASGWANLTKALGTTDLAVELTIGDIVISNGINDALWALECLPPREAVASVMPAVKRASEHTTDQRVHDCIAAVDSWIAGDDSVDLKAAEAAAAWAAANAARAAADAARAADAAEARAAAWAAMAAARAAADAARAAMAAARAAEARAARAAADAARAAERDMQASDLLAMFPPIRLKAKAAA